MSELPPDPPRLRAILAHLDKQLADTDTVRMYLQLQRQQVQHALDAAGRAPDRGTRQAPRRAPELPSAGPTARPLNGPTGDGSGFMLEQKKHPTHPNPATLHVDSCTMATQKTLALNGGELQAALREGEDVAPCEFCRPQSKIGDAIA
ncbi:DUF6233 domain-containing protein [Streptomyces sp. NPDC047990]|uniref:DUF6233 domain-containing protein n=1 Tax=Streptomyces sp. NPDC047990 TaxID=3365496 RepID=UPI00371A0E74